MGETVTIWQRMGLVLGAGPGAGGGALTGLALCSTSVSTQRGGCGWKAINHCSRGAVLPSRGREGEESALTWEGPEHQHSIAQ